MMTIFGTLPQTANRFNNTWRFAKVHLKEDNTLIHMDCDFCINGDIKVMFDKYIPLWNSLIGGFSKSLSEAAEEAKRVPPRAGAKDAATELTMRQELQILSVKRQEETLAFAKSMMTGIEANRLTPDAIDLLSEILSRPGRQVSGREEVISTLQCL